MGSTIRRLMKFIVYPTFDYSSSQNYLFLNFTLIFKGYTGYKCLFIFDSNFKKRLHMNEEEKLKLAEKIRFAFLENKKEIDLQIILDKFNNLEKLGVTNEFMELTIENEDFLIRINGNLWPPYTRNSETEGLEILSKYGIEHNVLVNGEGFQICKPFPKDMQLSQILKKNDPKAILNSLTLAATEIANYHNILLEQFSAIYPLEKMVNDVKNNLERKFTNFNPDAQDPRMVEAMEALQFLIRQCVKIPMVLQKCIKHKTFSQNDTIAPSIYIDSDRQKATLVDWEYAALGYWSNDLAILLTDLETEEQKSILANAYHQARTGVQAMMPEQQTFELKINTLAYSFLRMGWAINQNNLLKFIPIINELIEQLETVSSQINLLFMPGTMGFFSPSPISEEPYVPDRKEAANPSILLRNDNNK